MPAAFAASVVTRISPASASAARRAATFTASPRAVSDRSRTLANGAHPGDARVHAGAERRPRRLARLVAGGAHQRACRLDRAGGMLITRQHRGEVRDDFIANELVQEAVVLEHRIGRGVVEPIDQRPVLGRRHRLRQAG